LAQTLRADHYFDLENPKHRQVLTKSPQAVLDPLVGTIVIDEVQRVPGLFEVLRYLVDYRPKQRYVVLGSASGELLRQSGESLAGRIGYLAVRGFTFDQVGDMRRHWLRGGLPRSYLADDDEASMLWRENYIRTFLEKDVPLLGIKVASAQLHDFWMMLSHYQASIMNFSEIGRSFGVSDMTVRKYIDILRDTFMVRVLRPWSYNTRKRLVKAPKLYIRDSGVFHALQGIGSDAALLRHPKLGASWEAYALEETLAAFGVRDEDAYFWHEHGGGEVDLLWRKGSKMYAAEFKFSDAPEMTKSMRRAIDELGVERLYVVVPGKEMRDIDEKVRVIGIERLYRECKE
jgi:predicted AAA+ superfamily ATPase